jgi:hypothetical protein
VLDAYVEERRGFLARREAHDLSPRREGASFAKGADLARLDAAATRAQDFRALPVVGRAREEHDIQLFAAAFFG